MISLKRVSKLTKKVTSYLGLQWHALHAMVIDTSIESETKSDEGSNQEHSFIYNADQCG